MWKEPKRDVVYKVGEHSCHSQVRTTAETVHNQRGGQLRLEMATGSRSHGSYPTVVQEAQIYVVKSFPSYPSRRSKGSCNRGRDRLVMAGRAIFPRQLY